MSEQNSEFGAALKALRESAGLTQEQLAERAGLHRMGLAKLEQGAREPSWSTIKALCKALGVSCDAFMKGPGELPQPKPGRPPARKDEAKSEDVPPARPRGRPRKDAAGG